MLLEHYNLDIYKMAKSLGKSWVSTSNQIAYLRPAFLMEKVVIESQLINFTDSTLLVEMRMYNENKSELKSVFWAGFTHFNLLSQKRELHSDELSEFFQTLINPIEVNTFEERILQIKSQKKKPLKEV
jgi:acyl-CoA thioester hydrolase